MLLPGVVLDVNVYHGEAPSLHVLVTGQVSPYLSIVLEINLSTFDFYYVSLFCKQ